MKRTNRHLTLDVCATAIALLALTGTLAASSFSPVVRPQAHHPVNHPAVIRLVYGP